jgi:hypothetical protein
MTRGVQLVRLVASVAISLAACYFVVAYSGISFAHHRLEHPDAQPVVAFGMFLRAFGEYMYILPFSGLLIGLFVIWRWPNWQTLIETVMSALWLLALVWVGLVIWYCQVINLPIFHGMRNHYPY